MSELVVEFIVNNKDVWIDPYGVAWYVIGTDHGDVFLERRLTTTVEPKTFVRTWRKAGEGK